jgi:NAD(P)-dependent dehydrogenase (short-subunit alcohol dehydrogenase family)
VRNLEKGQKACAPFLSDRVTLIHLDTSSLSSVRACASSILEQTPALNVLICNAGIMMPPTHVLTADGFESQLATNYLGHFLLFWLLRPALFRGSTQAFQSRLVNVSSSGHQASEIEFDDISLSAPDLYTPRKGYGQSKLAQIYMANHVERLYGSRGLHALSLMPGGIATGLQVHMPQAVIDTWAADPKVRAFMKSPEQGAATTVFAAVSKEWEGAGGKYLEDCRVAKPDQGLAWGVAEYAYDEQKEKKLWDITLNLLGLKEDE